MKAVLGFLFVLVGVTVGWLVLSGKLPSSTAAAPATPAVPATAPSTPAAPKQTTTVLGTVVNP